jgi:hypothetical protein
MMRIGRSRRRKFPKSPSPSYMKRYMERATTPMPPPKTGRRRCQDRDKGPIDITTPMEYNIWVGSNPKKRRLLEEASPTS